MEELEQIKSAFLKADAAGDTASAKALHDRITTMQSAAPVTVAQAPKTALSSYGPSGGILDKLMQGHQEGKPPVVGGAVDKMTSAAIGGAVFGAATPEILAGLSAAAAGGALLFPPAAPFLAPASASLGEAALAATGIRTAAAIGGAISGLVSSGSGLIAKAAGGGETAQNVAELFGGLVPAALVAKPAKLAWSFLQKIIPGAESGTVKAVQVAQKNMRASIDQMGVPEHDAHITINKGIEANEKAASDAQGKLMADAHAKAAKLVASSPQDAERIMAEAKKQGASIVSQANAQTIALEKAAGGQLKTAARVKATAQPELDKVGQAKPISAIGDDLRGAIVPVQQKIIAERSIAYKEADKTVMAKSAQKEAEGVFPENLPQYRQMQDDLDKRLLSTPAGRKAAGGRETIGDDSVRAAYTKIQDVLKTRKIPTGQIDAQGNPVMESFKTTTEALRHLDRRLGEVAYGGSTDPTGFAALGSNIAKTEQRKIRSILNEYIGPEYQAMQTEYADASHELGIFGTKGGKAATAMSRVDPKSFLTDAANVPKQYFQSRTGVRDLIELTGGNKEAVYKAAASFAHHEMSGMSSEQAKKWIAKAADWLPEVPGLRQKAIDYATQLGRIEGTAANLEKAASRRLAEAAPLRSQANVSANKELDYGRKRAEDLIGQKVESGQKIVADAEKSSSAGYKEAVAKAQIVAKDGFAPEEMRKLLITGERGQLTQAARALAGTPGGKEAMLGTVRNTLSTLNPAALEKTWNGRLRELMQDGQLIPKPAFAKLDADVQAVFRAHEGKAAKTLVQQLIERAVPTVGAMGVSTVRAMGASQQ